MILSLILFISAEWFPFLYLHYFLKYSRHPGDNLTFSVRPIQISFARATGRVLIYIPGYIAVVMTSKFLVNAFLCVMLTKLDRICKKLHMLIMHLSIFCPPGGAAGIHGALDRRPFLTGGNLINLWNPGPA